MPKVLDKETVTKLLTLSFALSYANVVVLLPVIFCSGCGLASYSLRSINKSLPISPLPNSKVYSPVQTLALSPDEKYLIQGQHITAKEGESVSGDILQIWNIEQKKRTLVSRQRVSANMSATFSPDGKYVIACGNAGVIRVKVSDETVEQVPLEEPQYLSDDGSLVACLTNDGWQILSVDTPTEMIALPENVDRFLAFSPDKKYVATTVSKANTPGTGSTVAIWSLEHESDKQEETTPPLLVREIAIPSYFPSAEKTRFSPSGRYLALPSRQGGYVGIWDVETGKMYKELGVHDGSIRTLEFSQDGKILAVGTQEASGKYGKVYIWNAATGELLREPINENQAKGVTAICFASDNETIFIGNSSGEIKRKNIKGRDSLFLFLSQ